VLNVVVSSLNVTRKCLAALVSGGDAIVYALVVSS